MSNENEIISVREFAVPRARLIEAFTDPAALAQWWGPNGFTNTFESFELREGGAWKFLMHGPDGVDYPNEKHFTEVALPDRVVMDHLGPLMTFRMRMHWSETATGTRLEWGMRFDDADLQTRIRDFILEKNEENFDRLEAWLAR